MTNPMKLACYAYTCPGPVATTCPTVWHLMHRGQRRWLSPPQRLPNEKHAKGAKMGGRWDRVRAWRGGRAMYLRGGTLGRGICFSVWYPAAPRRRGGMGDGVTRAEAVPNE